MSFLWTAFAKGYIFVQWFSTFACYTLSNKYEHWKCFAINEKRVTKLFGSKRISFRRLKEICMHLIIKIQKFSLKICLTSNLTCTHNNITT